MKRINGMGFLLFDTVFISLSSGQMLFGNTVSYDGFHGDGGSFGGGGASSSF